MQWCSLCKLVSKDLNHIPWSVDLLRLYGVVMLRLLRSCGLVIGIVVLC